MEQEKRFRAAIQSARSLHPDLLTQGQKLKLYALFRHSQAPAPAEPPAEASELSQAKWEAWRDCHALTKLQAMDAYSEIIEGLVAVMSALEMEGEGPASPQGYKSEPMPPLRAVESAADGAVSAREAAADGVQEEAEAGMAADDAVEEDDEEEDDEAGVSVDEAPAVTPTVWSTAALTLAAGTTFEVPLALDTSSRCTYSFGVISGSGPVGFKLVGLSGESPAMLPSSPQHVLSAAPGHSTASACAHAEHDGWGVRVATLVALVPPPPPPPPCLPILCIDAPPSPPSLSPLPALPPHPPPSPPSLSPLPALPPHPTPSPPSLSPLSALPPHPLAPHLVVAGESLVLQYLSQGDGECEVAVPPAAGGGGVLIASIDNTAATFSAVEVRCRVCLESRAELTAREAYEGRRALRGLLVRKKVTAPCDALPARARSRVWPARAGREPPPALPVLSSIVRALGGDAAC